MVLSIAWIIRSLDLGDIYGFETFKINPLLGPLGSGAGMSSRTVSGNESILALVNFE